MIQEILGLNLARWNESIRRDEEPTQYISSYYVYI
jgi:hypothetical protein